MPFQEISPRRRKLHFRLWSKWQVGSSVRTQSKCGWEVMSALSRNAGGELCSRLACEYSATLDKMTGGEFRPPLVEMTAGVMLIIINKVW